MTERRRLGSSDLEISPVALGTWALGGWLWGGTERNRAEEAVLVSLDAGINCIDTAPAYGFGLSEELVGRALRGRRDAVVLATKCGLVWDDRQGGDPFFETQDNEGRPVQIRRNLTKESILAECDASLRRLGVEVIDLYQCHWPDPVTPVAETMEALETLRQQGKIRYYGLSNFSKEQIEEALRHGTPVSDQPKYSLLSRQIEADVLPFCRERGFGVLAYSPMEMGLLTGAIGMDREFPETDIRRNRPWFAKGKRAEVLRALEQVRPLARKVGITLGQLSVAWVFSQPGVTAALVGARNGEQARSNAATANVELDPDDLAAIRAVFAPLELDEPFDPATAKR